MEAYEVDRARWPFLLAPQLTGKAQQAYAVMPAEVARDYDELKTAILRRYDISEETYRQRFRTTKLNSGETQRELVTRLHDLAGRWAKDCTDVKDLLDLVVKEQFLGTLPSEARLWVSERKPKTSSEAGEMADDYMHARQTVRDPSTPEKAGKAPPGKCPRCGEPDHWARDCPKTGGRSPSNEQRRQPERDGVRCYKCQEFGHIVAQCPVKAALYCGERGESEDSFAGAALDMQTPDTKAERDCSVYRCGTVEGAPVSDILLDSGCTQTLVRKSLVPASAERINPDAYVSCVHGDVESFHRAKVRMTVGGRSLCLVVGVVDNLPTSVMLGRDVLDLVNMLEEPPKQQPLRCRSKCQRWRRQRWKQRLRDNKLSQEKGEECEGVGVPFTYLAVSVYR